MNDLIIKICGMREQADLDCAAALGVDLCGFIFAPQSPRAVTPEQAAALDSGDMLRVGVFVTDDMRFIEETARAARLDRIQLHGRSVDDLRGSPEPHARGRTSHQGTVARALSRSGGTGRNHEPARGINRNVPA